MPKHYIAHVLKCSQEYQIEEYKKIKKKIAKIN